MGYRSVYMKKDEGEKPYKKGSDFHKDFGHLQEKIPDIAPTSKAIAFTPTISPNFKEGGEIRNETWKDKVGGFLDKANSTLDLPQAAINKGMVIPRMINQKLFPEQVKEEDERLAKSPITDTVGTILGSIVPAVGIESGLAKLANYGFKAIKPISKISNALNTSVKLGEGLGSATKLAGRAVAGGAGYGALEGLGEGIEKNKGVAGTLESMGNKAYDYGVMGGVATAGLKGVGNLYKNTIGFNKGVEKVGQQVDNFKFPQLRDLRESTKPMLNNRGVELSPFKRDLPKNITPTTKNFNVADDLNPLSNDVNMNSPLGNKNPIESTTMANEANIPFKYEGKYTMGRDNVDVKVKDIGNGNSSVESYKNGELYFDEEVPTSELNEQWFSANGYKKEVSTPINNVVKETNVKNIASDNETTKLHEGIVFNGSHAKILEQIGEVRPNHYYRAVKDIAAIEDIFNTGMVTNKGGTTAHYAKDIFAKYTFKPGQNIGYGIELNGNGGTKFKYPDGQLGVDKTKKGSYFVSESPARLEDVSRIFKFEKAEGSNWQNTKMKVTEIYNSKNPNINKQIIPEPKQLPKSNFDHIKTVNDLPNDLPTLEAYVKEIQTKKDSGLELLDIDLQLFAEARKRMESLSKVYTNTFEKTDMFNQAEKDILNSSFTNDAKSSVKGELESLANAKKRLNDNYNGEYETLMNKELYSGEDVDTLFGMLENERNIARQTGDYTKVREIASKGVKEAGREGGRTVQAFAKYSRTPEGKIVEAQRAVDNVGDAVRTQNPKIDNAIKADTTATEQLTQSIKKESEKVIDEVVEQIEKVKRKTNKQYFDSMAVEAPPETSFPKMLQDKISSALNPKAPAERSFIKDLINDLFSQSKETVPFPKPLKPNSDIQKLGESYNFRNYKGEIRTKAQELLKEEFKDSPEALAMLDDYFNKGFKPPHSEKLLNDVLNKRLGGLNSGTTTTAVPSNKPNLKDWVKDWYGSGGQNRVDFVKGLVDEVGLTGEEAASFKNLLDSKLHNATKAMKDKLLETVMAQKKPGIIKNATTKLKEFVNIGGIENTKFTNRISEKISPMLKQLLKENDINLSEVVKSSLLGQTRMKLLGNLTDSMKGKISDIELENLMHIIKTDFNSLANTEKDKILKGVFGDKNPTTTKFASDKLTELTHAGMFESTKFANVISEKLDPTIRKMISENGLNVNDLVRLSTQENVAAKKDLIANFFNTTTIRGSERDKIIGFIEKEFEKVSKDTRTKILTEMAKPATSPTKRTMIEKLREKINLGLYGDDIEGALQDAVKQKHGLPTLSNDEVKFIVDTMDSIKGLPERGEKYLEAMAKVEKLILEKTPASLTQKVASGSFISMLGNFTSPLKNVAGNTLLSIPEVAGNPLARQFDKVVKGVAKTDFNTVGKTDFRALKEGAKQGVRSVKRDMLGGRDFKDVAAMIKGKSIKEQAKILSDITANPIDTDISTMGVADKFETGNRLAFDNKLGRTAENAVRTAMKIGDVPFNKAYYEDTLKQLMKVNNVTIATDDMIATAIQVSQERTYKDLNALSKTALKAKNIFQVEKAATNKGWSRLKEVPQIAMNSLVPFAKTPANIVKRGMEYSPLGLLEGAGKLIANKNNMTMMKQREIVDRLTRGTIGTGLLGAGYLANKSGLITDAKDKNSDTEKFKKESGILPDALKIGGKTVDLKGLQPITTPLIAGSRFNQGSAIGGITSGITGALEQYTDMPMLQGIENISTLISSNSQPYEKEKAWSNLVTALPKQYVPSIAKKLAYALDPFERDLGKGYIDNIIGKMPGISKLYPAKVDTSGNPIKSYGGKNSLLNTLGNPFVSKDITNNPINKEALRLNKNVNDTDLKNGVIPKEVSKDLGDINLTTEQQNQYQKLMGDKVKLFIEPMLNNPEYAQMSDQEKAIGFSSALDKARNDAKDEMLKILGVDSYQNKLDGQKKSYDKKVINYKLGIK